MDNYVLIRGARQLLTLHGPPGPRGGRAMSELGLIEDGSVLIKNNEIAAVGPTRRLENLREAKTAAVIPANGRVLMPGFVDPDLRVMLAGEFPSGRNRTVTRMAQEAATVLRSALQHGTTHAEVKAGGPLPVDDLRYLKQAKRLNRETGGVVLTWIIRPGPNETAETAVGLRKAAFEYARQHLQSGFVEIACDGGSCAAAAALMHAAAREGLSCKLVWRDGANGQLADLLSETKPKTVNGLERARPGDQLPALPGGIFVATAGRGMVDTAKCDWNIRALIDGGAAVALASGYDPVHSPVFNLQMAVAQAVLQMGMTTEEAITASTVNAACASGIGMRTGSLEYKKQADLLLLNLADYRELPHQFGVNHVGMAIRAGAVVFNRIGWKTVRSVTQAAH